MSNEQQIANLAVDYYHYMKGLEHAVEKRYHNAIERLTKVTTGLSEQLKNLGVDVERLPKYPS